MEQSSEQRVYKSRAGIVHWHHSCMEGWTGENGKSVTWHKTAARLNVKKSQMKMLRNYSIQNVYFLFKNFLCYLGTDLLPDRCRMIWCEDRGWGWKAPDSVTQTEWIRQGTFFVCSMSITTKKQQKTSITPHCVIWCMFSTRSLWRYISLGYKLRSLTLQPGWRLPFIPVQLCFNHGNLSFPQAGESCYKLIICYTRMGAYTSI